VAGVPSIRSGASGGLGQDGRWGGSLAFGEATLTLPRGGREATHLGGEGAAGVEGGAEVRLEAAAGGPEGHPVRRRRRQPLLQVPDPRLLQTRRGAGAGGQDLPDQRRRDLASHLTPRHAVPDHTVGAVDRRKYSGIGSDRLWESESPGNPIGTFSRSFSFCGICMVGSYDFMSSE